MGTEQQNRDTNSYTVDVSTGTGEGQQGSEVGIEPRKTLQMEEGGFDGFDVEVEGGSCWMEDD